MAQDACHDGATTRTAGLRVRGQRQRPRQTSVPWIRYLMGCLLRQRPACGQCPEGASLPGTALVTVWPLHTPSRRPGA
eukprot:scaffold2045_cov404-Prasinococcus_capsulatus_cf.AAC.14